MLHLYILILNIPSYPTRPKNLFLFLLDKVINNYDFLVKSFVVLGSVVFSFEIIKIIFL